MSKTAFVLGAERTLELINRLKAYDYDAVFITPDGKLLYSDGLRPPTPRPEGSAAPPATGTIPRG
jgi:hypothetical protein